MRKWVFIFLLFTLFTETSSAFAACQNSTAVQPIYADSHNGVLTSTHDGKHYDIPVSYFIESPTQRGVAAIDLIVDVSNFLPACALRIQRGLNEGGLDAASSKPAYKEFLKEIAFVSITALSQPNKDIPEDSSAYALRCAEIGESYCTLAFPYGGASLVRVQFSKIHAANSEKIKEKARKLIEKFDSKLPLIGLNDEGFFEQHRREALRGDSMSQAKLGYFYENGQGVAKNDKEAAKWYSKAAEQGRARAQYSLGIMYQEGRGVPQDYEAAYFWKGVAEKNGLELPEHWRDDLAKHLTQMQLNTLKIRISDWQKPTLPLTPEEIARAAAEEEKLLEDMARMRAQADEGTESSQMKLGELYLSGKGVKQDFKQAFFWLTLAEHRSDKKRNELAEQAKSHLTPEEIADVQKQKIDWWLAAAQNGVPYASNEVGKWYAGAKNGMGFPLDCQEAQFWLSMTTIGIPMPAGPCGNLSTTDFSPEMQKRLEEWQPSCVPGRECVNTSRISKAAHGDPQAQYQLGIKFENEKKYSEALRWYQRAIRQGNGDSAMNLAQLYMRGAGMEADPAEAYYLMLLARKAGVHVWSVPLAEEDPTLKKLASQIPPEKHIEIQKRLTEWKPVLENPR